MTGGTRFGEGAAQEGQSAGDRRELGGLARGSGLNLIGTVVSQVTAFALVLVIARSLGTHDLGVYSQAVAVRALLHILLLFGMRNAMVRWVASFRADGDAAAIRGTIRIGLITAATASAVAALALYALSPWLAETVFSEPDLVESLRWVALSLPFMVIMTVAIAATRGFSSMKAFAGIGLVMEPSLRLALTMVAVALGWGLTGAMVALVVATVLAGLAALMALSRYLRRVERVSARYPVREVSSFAAVSWVASVATNGLVWVDIVILGALMESEDVGIYQIATRLVLFTISTTRPLVSNFAPRVAELWRRKELGRLLFAQTLVAGWTWRLTLAALAPVVVFPAALLAFFDPLAVAGVSVVLILALGAAVHSQGAPAGTMLNMAGHNTLNMYNSMGALVFNVVLNFALIPPLGILGAGIAWSATLGLFGIMRMLQARYLVTDAYALSPAHRKGVVAFLAAIAIGVPLSLVLGDTAQVLLGTPIVMIVYFLVLRMMGFDADDLRAVQSLRDAWNDLSVRLSTRRRNVKANLRHRSLPLGETPVLITSLVSPLRYDILVRAEFIQLVRARRIERSTDFSAFLYEARDTDYYEWFRYVASRKVGIDPDNKGQIDRAFETRVRRTCQLVDDVDANGYRSDVPILLRTAGDRPTVTGKQLDPDRLQPHDGCHRLALLMLDGERDVLPHQYRIVDNPEPPLDNTKALLDRLDIDKDDYYSFIATGFGKKQRVAGREELMDWVSRSAPDKEEEVAQILDVDEPLLPVG